MYHNGDNCKKTCSEEYIDEVGHLYSQPAKFDDPRFSCYTPQNRVSKSILQCVFYISIIIVWILGEICYSRNSIRAMKYKVSLHDLYKKKNFYTSKYVMIWKAKPKQ